MIEDLLKARGNNLDSRNKLHRPRQIVRGMSKRSTSKDLFASLSASKTLLKIKSPIKHIEKNISINS